ncbi:hypothetical protein ILUMI_06562 [Ignelater luminosus]|uniref:Uncharacterized protein n=1 Tax=Ignelater luminosus TaxID=2038154 RepID=A0A8K0D522_IGNLU|nr:hypothetical protein ILUMI_06562 [Ignelater luminosus]
MFWPVMASVHCISSVTRYLEEQNLEYVHKVENVAKVPQARPIEQFWAICKKEFRRQIITVINHKNRCLSSECVLGVSYMSTLKHIVIGFSLLWNMLDTIAHLAANRDRPFQPHVHYVEDPIQLITEVESTITRSRASN